MWLIIGTDVFQGRDLLNELSVFGGKESRKAPIWSAARTLDSAPAVIFDKGTLFLPNFHNAHRCGWDGTRPRYANVLRTVLLEPNVTAGFVLSFPDL